MVCCSGNHLAVYNVIKGKKIDVDKLPALPSDPAKYVAGTWYRHSTFIYYMKDDTSNTISISYNDTAYCCINNPIEDCDNCMGIPGTWTEAELTTAANKLPFVIEKKSSSLSWAVGGAFVGGATVALVSYILKKKK